MDARNGESMPSQLVYELADVTTGAAEKAKDARRDHPAAHGTWRWQARDGESMPSQLVYELADVTTGASDYFNSPEHTPQALRHAA